MKKVFECKRCGFCCQGDSTVSLSPEEIRRMAHYLKISESDFLKRFAVERGRRIEMKTINGHCIFYDKRQGCRVHPVKPDRCREWPLHPSILKDPENFEIIRSSCPGFAEDLGWEEVKRLLKNESGYRND